MNKNNSPSNQYSFKKSLKDESKYPYLKYLRVERYFTRPLASLIVRMVFKTSIIPNHLTYVSFFIGVTAGIIYCFGEPTYFLIAGILTQLTSVFDCADGQLARSKNMCTHYGTYLDLFLDRIAELFIFGGIVIGYYNYSHDFIYFMIGSFLVALYFLQVSLYYIMNNFKKTSKAGEAAAPRGLAVFVVFVFSVLNRLDILIWIFAVELVINISYKIMIMTGVKNRE